MAIQLILTGEQVVALGSDSETGERGVLVKIINRTGHTSLKGEVLAASKITDKEAVLEGNEYDAIAVIQQAGVAEGNLMWVWVNGIAQVLFKDSVAAVRGYVAISADTDGRANNVDVPTANPVVAEHFKEIGHVLESKDAGTNVLVLVNLHFN